MFNLSLIEGYEEVAIVDENIIDSLIWNADDRLTYDEVRALEKLKLNYDKWEKDGLSNDDIVEIINTHTDDYGVEYIIENIKAWVYTERDEVTLDEYTEQIIEWGNMTKGMLQIECNFYDLHDLGTKKELVERLVKEYQRKYDVKTI